MTLIKICGITNQADLLAAIEVGADMVGFIFHPNSPRAVTADQVASMTATLRGLDAPRIPLCIGVFVDPDPFELPRILSVCRLGAAQVHRTRPEKLRQIAFATNGAFYPALQAQTFEEITTVLAHLSDEMPSAPPWLPQLLLDAYHPTLAGGTGSRADLDLARRAAKTVSRFMLAGGLTPENVGEAVRAVRPWAVDVSSGVEARPALKDQAKLRAFAAAVRAADAD